VPNRACWSTASATRRRRRSARTGGFDDALYDHDPDLYEVIVVEGRRTLCELGGRGRRPCQYTDGPGPLTEVDVWYDGQFVYDTP
jgi:hypothetical protein